MNINELEKLARAATPGAWKSSMTAEGGPVYDSDIRYWVAEVFLLEDKKYIAAANPAAILELIDSHRKLSDLLSRAFGAIIRDSDGKLLSEAMSALNKANGESNE